jgi:hypothetical protein
MEVTTMKRFKCSLVILFILASVTRVSALESKVIIHMSTLPVTEGLGIYSSAIMIRDGNANCKAAGITNISLLALNAGLGSFIAFGKPSNYQTFARIHHIIGFTAIGASLWLTVSGTLEKSVPSHVRYTSGGYTLMTTVPLFIFNF